jgi:DnaB-like helicase C terminal domain/Bifunctional DNA primase/polymerase, N-terminal/Primase C terminal 1 (PriCT-1)
MTPCHLAAKAYRQMGLHPIPCAPRSKRPLIEWRLYQEEAPHPDQIDAWWEQYPDANVALVLGRGTFAVDLDGGHEAERLLTDAGVYLPGAPRSKTANGYHVLLSASGPVPDRVALLSARGGKPAVDIRGVGIIVAPPSIHPTWAAYEWYIPLTLPLPPAPQALIDLITSDRRPPAPGSVGWVAEALAGVGEGARDATCTKLAGYFLGRGLDVGIVETVLIESFARHCTPPFAIEDVRKCVRSIARKEGPGPDRPLAPVHVSRVLAQLEDALQPGSTHAPAVPTPFPSLNTFLSGGLYPGELFYLGARPGVGKTALGLEVARWAGRQGRGVLVISREMVNLALARRLVAQEGQIRASGLRSGSLDAAERVTLPVTIQRLSTLPIWLTDEAVSITEIAECVRAWGASTPLGLVIVDYLQLVRAPRDIRERRLQVEAVSQELKSIALEAKIPVLCLSSLARPPAGVKDTRPTLASLRESGELEHDADVVLLLHRAYNTAPTECIVAKNRDGRQGVVSLIFRPEFVSFDEVSEARP